jgi:hypothetical protein
MKICILSWLDKKHLHCKTLRNDIRYPPSDSAYLTTRLVRNAKYTPKDSEWIIEELEGETPWIDFENSIIPVEPLVIHLNPGDCLYLPSMWYHQVEQKSSHLNGMNATIAVNYWFDMDFSDGRYALMETLNLINNLKT